MDGGLVGGARLAWPKRAREGRVPPWLVFGAMIRIVEMAERKPGVLPLGAALEEEGFHVTVDRWVYHRFYGETGKGTVLVGEVSQVNDDKSDNYFLDPIGRFAKIEEDEPPLRVLWNEVAG